MLISCIGLLFMPDTSTQVVFVVIINLASAVAGLKFKPFSNADDSQTYTLMQWWVPGYPLASHHCHPFHATRVTLPLAFVVAVAVAQRWVRWSLVVAHIRAISLQSFFSLLLRSGVSKSDNYGSTGVAAVMITSQVSAVRCMSGSRVCSVVGCWHFTEGTQVTCPTGSLLSPSLPPPLKKFKYVRKIGSHSKPILN